MGQTDLKKSRKHNYMQSVQVHENTEKGMINYTWKSHEHVSLFLTHTTSSDHSSFD